MAKPNVMKKETLIECAKTCLVDQGIGGFTLKAVAEIAGVTQGTVYYHFKTKEQLMLEVVANVCSDSWGELTAGNLQDALQSARSRCQSNSFFHQLFFTLLSVSFHHDQVKHTLGQLLERENEALTALLQTAFDGKALADKVSSQTLGILGNALIDGLAIQALTVKDFPADQVYAELGALLGSIEQRSEGGS